MIEIGVQYLLIRLFPFIAIPAFNLYCQKQQRMIGVGKGLCAVPPKSQLGIEELLSKLLQALAIALSH